MRWRVFQALLAIVLTAGMTVFALPAVAQSAARPQVKLPEGPVRSVLLKNCVSCHGIDDYAFHAMDRKGWQELINTLHIHLAHPDVVNEV